VTEVNLSIQAKIQDLKHQRNAVILAHNYQSDEVQDLADFTGDSLELSRQAATTDADVIIFCGVHFMAETASILSPRKTVVLPDPHAGCPMADMITAEQVRSMKKAHPGAVVVCYVNSTAEVKAESDVCCTSANAVQVVASIPEGRQILFVPDKYLGQHVSLQTRRPMILWNGYCPTHVRIMDTDITRARSEHPGAVVMVHPECTEAVRRLADHVLSTGQMCRFAQTSSAVEFIIGTERGIFHRLNKENPAKRFYPAAELALCPNMKKIDLEKVLWSLETLQHEVRVPDEIRTRARTALDAMLNT
jgi:quinolinate synthase